MTMHSMTQCVNSWRQQTLSILNDKRESISLAMRTSWTLTWKTCLKGRNFLLNSSESEGRTKTATVTQESQTDK